MFFLPFLAGAAVIGAGAYYISKVIQSNKPITINLLKEILFQEAHNSLRSIIKKSGSVNLGIFNGVDTKNIFNNIDTTYHQRSEIGCSILACKDKAIDKGIMKSYVDVNDEIYRIEGSSKSYVDVKYNDKIYRIEGPSISPEVKPGITC
jgi:hypothetical protein